MAEILEFKFDTQLLIEGHDLDEDEINDYITEHFKGDCLLAVGDDELIKIHFHTNEPWQVLEYCASLGNPRHCGGEHAAAERRSARLIAHNIKGRCPAWWSEQRPAYVI